MRQILILIAQLGKVAFVQCILLIALRNGIQFQQSSLSHENGLYLEQVITMLAYSLQGDMACPLLESVAIDAKAIVASKGYEESIFPRPTRLLGSLFYRYRFLFQSFCLQSSHPRMNHQTCQVGNDTIAGRISVRPKQFCIVLANMLRHRQHHLWYKVSLLRLYITIGHPHHMQHYVIIMDILVVSMQIPVARLVMYLDIAHPQRSVYLHFRVEEVRPSISVM